MQESKTDKQRERECERLEEVDKGGRSGGPIILQSITPKEPLHLTAKAGAGVGQGLKESVGSYCNGNAIWGVLHAELKAGWCLTGRNRQERVLNRCQNSPKKSLKLAEQGWAKRMGSPLTWKQYVERDYGCSVPCERSPRDLFYSHFHPPHCHLLLALPSPLPPASFFLSPLTPPYPKDKRLFEGLVVRSRGERRAMLRCCHSLPFHAQ